MSFTGTGQLTPGPKVPVEIKKQRGTWRADRDEGKISVPSIDEIPVAPEYFNESQIQEWYRVCTTLKDIGILHDVGIFHLEAYCRYIDQYRRATKDVEERGDTLHELHIKGKLTVEIEKINPNVTIANNAYEKILAISGHFGFTPAAATRIKSPGKKDKPIDDEFGF